MLKFNLLIVFLTTFISYAQEYNYSLYSVHLEYNESSEVFTPELLAMLEPQIEEINNLQLEINFNKSLSFTRKVEALSKGSLNTTNKSTPMLSVVGLGRTEYVDFTNGTYFFQKGGNSIPKHLVQYNDMLKWDITTETKVKNNITLRKATAVFTNDGGKKYKTIAWFDASKPQSIGPAHFNGLPGVITELSIDLLEGPKFMPYTLNLIKLENKKIESFTVPPKELKILTFEESEDLYRRDFEKFKNNN